MFKRTCFLFFVTIEIQAFVETREVMRQVREVAPGHFLPRKGIKPYYTSNEDPTLVSFLAHLHTMIDHAISKQLEADIDIKIGIFLSDGSDSSTTAAAASKRQDIIAFIIGTWVTPDVEAARVVGKLLKIRLVVTIVDPSDLGKRLREVI